MKTTVNVLIAFVEYTHLYQLHYFDTCEGIQANKPRMACFK